MELASLMHLREYLDLSNHSPFNWNKVIPELRNTTDSEFRQIKLCNNSLIWLPPSFFYQFIRPELITFLDVSNNFLTFLPEELGSLTNLKTLKASKNRIEKILTNFKLLKENLHILYLDNNRLPFLPESIESLTLVYFNCENNPFVVQGLDKHIEANQAERTPPSLVILCGLEIRRNYQTIRHLCEKLLPDDLQVFLQTRFVVCSCCSRICVEESRWTCSFARTLILSSIIFSKFSVGFYYCGEKCRNEHVEKEHLHDSVQELATSQSMWRRPHVSYWW